jgi:MOSC domain-containing protein YiiM
MLLIHSIFVGQPEIIPDPKGDWNSSIFRKPVTNPIELGSRGLAGDRVTDTLHHGRASQAVCVHPLEHYGYWNQRYNLGIPEKRLGPGSVGENWTVKGGSEETVCVGDIYTIGSAKVQISGPRGPCWKQERKLKLDGFLKATIETLRTGFYVRVLKPGTVRPGDEWHLESRSNPWLTVHFMNACYYKDSDPEMIERILATPEVAEEWKSMFRRGFRQKAKS